MKNQVIQGDCLIEMQNIPDKSIDMILCDLPYGTTACEWDSMIPFDRLWEQYRRIIKDHAAIVLTASQPFTSALVMSNLDMFSCSWIWEKEQGVNFLLSKKQPLKIHEDILIFSKKQPTYYPIMTKGTPYISGKGTSGATTRNAIKVQTINTGTRYPKSIIKINRARGLHPTQKPVILFEYFIKTYTKENDLVLDNCAGSGTTGVACKNLNRNYILIEKEPEYIKIINQRLNL